MTHQSFCLLRLPQTLAKVGKGKSSLYLDIKQGLFPPPVHLGARISAWLEHEADAINAARIAGKTDEEIRSLVVDLVSARKEGI